MDRVAELLLEERLAAEDLAPQLRLADGRREAHVVEGMTSHHVAAVERAHLVPAEGQSRVPVGAARRDRVLADELRLLVDRGVRKPARHEEPAHEAVALEQRRHHLGVAAASVVEAEHDPRQRVRPVASLEVEELLVAHGHEVLAEPAELPLEVRALRGRDAVVVHAADIGPPPAGLRAQEGVRDAGPVQDPGELALARIDGRRGGAGGHASRRSRAADPGRGP